MRWCDHNDVEYVFGMARNKRLLRRLQADLDLAQRKHARTGQPVRRFKDCTYRTLKSWSRRRRIVGKAEFLDATIQASEGEKKLKKGCLKI